MRDLNDALHQWLGNSAARIGQVLIRPVPEGWQLCHVDDQDEADLPTYSSPSAARDIANLDAAGKFRPLKTTPDLIRGWKLVLPDAAAVRRALDYLYPAMVAVWQSHQRRVLSTGFLRETLGRQTGMYRVTQKISDEQARSMIDGFCSGCLKQRLWEIDAPNPAALTVGEREIPLICHEACNLLVAEARKVVKSATA